tara:strand:+ start:419 stop:748 length:330 start_codon:yes stop_codon:yes gene_type:complete
MKSKKILIFLFFILFLNSCSGVKDTLEGKKRSENSDEFLVEKKNPLVVPPDMNELPVPLSDEEDQSTKDKESIDIKKTLKIQENQISSSENINGKNNNLETEILEKINN